MITHKDSNEGHNNFALIFTVIKILEEWSRMKKQYLLSAKGGESCE